MKFPAMEQLFLNRGSNIQKITIHHYLSSSLNDILFITTISKKQCTIVQNEIQQLLSIES